MRCLKQILWRILVYEDTYLKIWKINGNVSKHNKSILTKKTKLTEHYLGGSEKYLS
jgi:hypothetical protein